MSEELPTGLFLEDAPCALTLKEFDGSYLESEQACSDIMQAYSESSAMGMKFMNTKRDIFNTRTHFIVGCEFSGKPKQGVRKTGMHDCPFRVSFCRCESRASKHFGMYKVKVLCTGHNHNYTRKALGTEALSDAAVRHIASNPSRMPLQLAADIRASEGVVVTNKMVSAIRRTLKNEESNDDLSNVLGYLRSNGMSYSLRKVGKVGLATEVAAVLFAKTSSQAAFQRFSDVLLVDTTYGTNEYRYPLVNFVGIDNHGFSFLAASAIILDETKESFKDILSQFLTMTGTTRIPVIVADGDDALRAAVKALLPETLQLQCRWHLGLNLKKSMQKKKASHSRREEALAAFYSLAWQEDEKKYDEQCLQFSGKHAEAADYLKRIRLHEQRWAECYTKYLPKLECDTSQRVESMHSRVKLVLKKEELCFYELVKAVSDTMDEQEAKRHREDALSIQRNLVELSPELIGLAGMIPIEILKNLNNLWKADLKLIVSAKPDGSFLVAGETFSTNGCSCVRWRSLLLPCLHFVAVAKSQNIAVVPSMINPRWRLAQNLTVFASPFLFPAVANYNTPQESEAVVEDFEYADDSGLNNVAHDSDSSDSDAEQTAMELSVLSNFFSCCKQAVDSKNQKLHDELFNELIPSFFQLMIDEYPDTEVPMVLREKLTHKGRPRKQPRIKSLVELEEESLKK